jgi:hypothetical protein
VLCWYWWKWLKKVVSAFEGLELLFCLLVLLAFFIELLAFLVEGLSVLVALLNEKIDSAFEYVDLLEGSDGEIIDDDSIIGRCCPT